MRIYVFIEEDATSAFKGKGKISLLKKRNANPIYHFVFESLGEEWAVSDDICSKSEAFTGLIFGYTREKRVNVVSAKMLRKRLGENNQLTLKSKFDLSKLPPAEDNLKPHIYRVNHRVGTYKRASAPISWTPKPWEENQVWVKNGKSVLEPMWSLWPVL